MTKTILPIDIKRLKYFHDFVIKITGGELGILDKNGLYDLNRTIENHYYFGKKTLIEVSAYLVFTIVSNHYFVDGNKRAALIGFFMFANQNLQTLNYKTQNHEWLVLEIAKGKIELKEVETIVGKWFYN